MYHVLARRWRPKNFQELVGQEHISAALGYALEQQRLHHAYLFTGTRGVGKTTIARIFAKSINCLTNGISAHPCGECNHCQEIDAGNFPDLIEIDAASRTGVDDTREILNNVPYAPVKGRFKVYLIDEVHMFSRSSFNALLKTLEEPPEHVKFILATTDPQKLPVTILSRCLQFHLKNIGPAQIVAQLQHILHSEAIPFENEALQLLAEGANGSLRDALSLLDQAIISGQGQVNAASTARLLGAIPQQQLLQLLLCLARGDGPGLRGLLQALDEYAPDYALLVHRLLQMLQTLTVIQLHAQRPGEALPPVLVELAPQLPLELVQLWYEILGDTWQSLPYQPEMKLAVEMGLLRMLALRPLLPQSDPARAPTIAEAGPIQLSNVASDAAFQAEALRPAAPANPTPAPEALPNRSAPPANPPLEALSNRSASPVPPPNHSPGHEALPPDAPHESRSASPSSSPAAPGSSNSEALPSRSAPPSPAPATSPAPAVEALRPASPANPSMATEALPNRSASPNPSPAANPAPAVEALRPLNLAPRPAAPSGEALPPVVPADDQPPWATDPSYDRGPEGPAEVAPVKKPAPAIDWPKLLQNPRGWGEFIATLPLGEKARQLANNSCPLAYADRCLTLGLDATLKNFFSAGQAELAAILHCAIQLEEAPVATPFGLASAERDQQQNERERQFRQHPLIQATVQLFGARVEDIKPLN